MIRAIATVFRLKLSVLNGISALAGYALFPHSVSVLSAGVVCGGVTLLAAGGSALNQVLERDIDALMTRTRQRPLPDGRLTALAASCAGAGAVLAGLVLLGASGSVAAPLSGAAALAGYLLVYTPLKRRTALALPLGAICGATPPLIGWCLAGGVPSDYRIIILCGLFFLWQMPHFWLLQERHAADYRRIGIPLADISRGLLILWVVALSVATLLLPLFGLIVPSAALWFFPFPLLLVWLALTHAGRPLFTCLNLFPLLLTFMFLRG